MILITIPITIIQFLNLAAINWKTNKPLQEKSFLFFSFFLERQAPEFFFFNFLLPLLLFIHIYKETTQSYLNQVMETHEARSIRDYPTTTELQRRNSCSVITTKRIHYPTRSKSMVLHTESQIESSKMTSRASIHRCAVSDCKKTAFKAMYCLDHYK